MPTTPDYRTLVDASTLAAHLDDGGWIVVDCRFNLADVDHGEKAYREAHVPGAFYAHLDRDLSSPITPSSGRHPLPGVEALKRWLGQLGVGPTSQVVAYDDSGGTMAVRLWWLLRWLGHDRVALLDGGWQQWTGQALPVEQQPRVPAASGVFTGTVDFSQVVTSAEIERELATEHSPLLLLDARTGERFRGEQEPIDPVAGHVPRAVNLPLNRNLGTDGRFLAPDALRAIYRAAIGDRAPGQVAVMCGSGVTACHNLLAMEIAGLGGGRLYAGSWSEWIRDPQRPVATGD
jgi:thiosulfate/3-mercaptopyruvate sulfurtransferase